VIQLKNLSKTFSTRAGKITALQKINLHIHPGEIFGVIGQSGAGKSTLIRCVNLLERPDEGEILIKNKNILKFSSSELCKLRHHMGMIFQHFNLLSSRNVYDNIALPLELLNYSSQEIKKTIEPLIELTGLENKTQAFPRQLSGGQKQRVAVARALASNPDIILCDEATSALDIQTSHAILALLRDINKKWGITILVITHQMDVVKNLCDRVALLSHGEILECASVVDFFTRPKTEKAKKLIETLLHRELPDKLTQRMQASSFASATPVWRIFFKGQSAETPLISVLIQTFHLEINIFQGNIENLKDETLGILDVTVKGTEENIKKGMAYLREKGAQVEVMGYV